MAMFFCRQKAPLHAVSLDAVNFLLADVRGALGPFLNVFLVTQQHWSQTSVGLVTIIGGLFGLAAQTPIGAAIDATRAKRGAIVLALAVVAAGALTIAVSQAFWPVLVASCLVAMAGDVFGPAVASLTLGLFAQDQLARRLGRNASFDHAGNVFAALVAAVVGYVFSQGAVFLLAPVFAVLAVGAVLSIPVGAIDYQRARGWDAPDRGRSPTAQALSWKILLKKRPLVVFGVCIMLFHFANAPLLPLVGQKLAGAHPRWATAMMASCIVAAQCVMIPLSLLAGKAAARLGRKPVLLVAFAVLPVRAVLYTFSDNTAWLVAVQLLDGVGAGILSVLTPLVIADVMRGTGHYNLAQGAVATMLGIGASLSGLATGMVVDAFGYDAAFLGLGGTAVAALAMLVVGMPETASMPTS